MRIAITGATGLLGRNLLFEIIKQNISSLSQLEIIVFGRQSHRRSLEKRISEMIKNDGLDYLGVKTLHPETLLDELKSVIKPVEFDLTKKDLSISPGSLSILKDKKIDTLFHVAALSDFRVTPQIKKDLDLINVEGTAHLLSLAKDLGVGEFVYTGSAYSAGYVEGDVPPDYVNPDGKFRNHYEKTKLKAELYLKQYAKDNKMGYKIFRLTGIGGRLMEKPLGSISKYDIFYGWMMFFIKQKMKSVKDMKDIYSSAAEMPVSVALNRKGGMNVVPADYSAKIMYAACMGDSGSKSYHIVNDIDIPNADAIRIMFDSLNINGWKIIEEEPKDKNPLEKLYYRSAGQIFTPYVMTGPICYNHDNLVETRKRSGIDCPHMTEKNFRSLLDFAKADHFGMSSQGV